MISYREANAFDLPVFASLDKELFPYSPWSASQYKEEFSSSTRHFVVAVDDAQNIIGYAGVFAPGGAEADVLTVGVVPSQRGKGIARQLMAQITDWAGQQGSTAMMLEVKVDNLQAIGLYDSLGYAKLNTRKDYFGAGLDALVMRLELP
jgi:ribosomal-protein-alanine N-acetyltransferase